MLIYPHMCKAHMIYFCYWYINIDCLNITVHFYLFIVKRSIHGYSLTFVSSDYSKHRSAANLTFARDTFDYARMYRILFLIWSAWRFGDFSFIEWNIAPQLRKVVNFAGWYWQFCTDFLKYSIQYNGGI